ncbi:DUF222 domain-containing protein, partial [Microbacterium sp. H83]|uniref:DUF222 domain-containing protein n=1 Tax=Microbacterium sp. H83 TaxID=1827324 RepID=UPI000A4876D7
TSPRVLLDRVVADLDRVLSDDALAGVSDAERVEILQAAGAVRRRVDAVVVETLATGHPVEFPHAAGCRSQSELLQRTLLVDVAGATRLGKMVPLVLREISPSSGERLPARWPALRDALLGGVISVSGMLAATTPIEKIAHRISADERLGADEHLADAARGARDPESPGRGPAPTTEQLKLLADMIAALLDPDGEMPGNEPERRRGVTLGRIRDGLRPIRGWLTPDVAAQLELLLDAITNPKGDGPPVPDGVRFTAADDDTRTPD